MHRFLVAAARSAEAAGVDFLVLADRPARDREGAGPPAAVIAAALLAGSTNHIGVVVSAAPAYYEPYNLARMIASLDHISRGRAGWRVVTGSDAAADANHRREGTDPAVGRDARTAEFVPLVRDLWDTWEDGALVHDKATGRLIDSSRIHVLDHIGPALRVRGPLNLARPPQGHPVVLAEDADPLVSASADIVIVGDPDSVSARRAGSQPVIAAVMPFVAQTQAQARDLHADLGAPVSNQERAVIVGDGDEITDRLTTWAGSGVVDGFMVRLALPDQLDTFTELVLPRLRPPGSGHAGGTAMSLRARLGLARPPNRVAVRVTASADQQELTSHAH
jgi:alkanesulfonate monooxygenase SsuD/methylene tetrahydromethanopterin reductase-like flavin-dependent oxidoreductase (luciferase family)